MEQSLRVNCINNELSENRKKMYRNWISSWKEARRLKKYFTATLKPINRNGGKTFTESLMTRLITFQDAAKKTFNKTFFLMSLVRKIAPQYFTKLVVDFRRLREIENAKHPIAIEPIVDGVKLD